MPNTPSDIAETERHARLFKNGRNQALRIPREFELPGDEAVIRKEGDRLIIEPIGTMRRFAVNSNDTGKPLARTIN